jgi:hypothetical protein
VVRLTPDVAVILGGLLFTSIQTHTVVRQVQGKIWLSLPITAAGLRGTVTRLAVVSAQPMGVEVVVRPGLEEDRTDDGKGSQYYDLTGLSAEAACKKIVTFVPDYECEVASSVLHFRPRRFRNDREVALNRRVGSYTLDVPNAEEALFRVHQLFDPSYPAGLSVSSIARLHQSDRVRALFSRPISVTLRGGTVRELLDAIVMSRGRISWMAEYKELTGGYSGLRLSLIGVDDWAVHATAKK